ILLVSWARASAGLGIVLFDAAHTVEELLGCAERSVVQFLDAIQQPKAHTELCVQRLSVVAHNLKPTAFRRSLRSKRANKHIPTRLHRAGHLANVGSTLPHCGKEMKYGAVMPHIVCIRSQF